MGLWVFGYGSLLWNPGFPFTETKLARLDGYRRSFCMSSIHHRGTVENPGLVLALDKVKGAVCNGLAFHVSEDDTAQTLAYLRERELISSAYVEVTETLMDTRGRTFEAVAYIIDQNHEQYSADLSLERQATIIANAVGGRGHNAEYLHNTVEKLKALGISDTDLTWLDKEVRRIMGAYLDSR